jgi:hypothetical protein
LRWGVLRVPLAESADTADVRLALLKTTKTAVLSAALDGAAVLRTPGIILRMGRI